MHTTKKVAPYRLPRSCLNTRGSQHRAWGSLEGWSPVEAPLRLPSNCLQNFASTKPVDFSFQQLTKQESIANANTVVCCGSPCSAYCWSIYWCSPSTASETISMLVRLHRKASLSLYFLFRFFLATLVVCASILLSPFISSALGALQTSNF